eukprot:3720529-Prymnesium_polylepis.1
MQGGDAMHEWQRRGLLHRVRVAHSHLAVHRQPVCRHSGSLPEANGGASLAVHVGAQQEPGHVGNHWYVLECELAVAMLQVETHVI